jgi:hypothetical protein
VASFDRPCHKVFIPFPFSRQPLLLEIWVEVDKIFDCSTLITKGDKARDCRDKYCRELLCRTMPMGQQYFDLTRIWIFIFGSHFELSGKAEGILENGCLEGFVQQLVARDVR